MGWAGIEPAIFRSSLTRSLKGISKYKQVGKHINCNYAIAPIILIDVQVIRFDT